MSKQAHHEGNVSSTITQEKQPDLHISGKQEKIVLNWAWEETESGKTVALTNLSNAVNKAIAAKTIEDGLVQCFSGTGGAAAANYIALKLTESIWNFVVVEGVNGDKLEVTVPESKKEGFIAVVKRRTLVQELQKNMAMDKTYMERLLNGVPDWTKNMLANAMKSFRLNSVTFSDDSSVDKEELSPPVKIPNTKAGQHSEQDSASSNVVGNYSDGLGSVIKNEAEGNKDFQIIAGQMPDNVKVAKNFAVRGGKIENRAKNNQNTIAVGNFTPEQLRAMYNH